MIDEISDFQKNIYNIYLKYLAIKNNRPFSKRKDFSKIDDATRASLLKLELFFNRNHEINIDLYFKVGFETNENTFLNLGYFHNIIVLKNYSKFIKNRYNNPIDSPEIIKDIISGLQFIISFVKSNNILLSDYTICKNDKQVLWCLIHLKQQQISLYHLHLLNFSLSNLDNEILDLFLENFKQKFFETKRQYQHSSKIKMFEDKIRLLLNNKSN